MDIQRFCKGFKSFWSISGDFWIFTLKTPLKSTLERISTQNAHRNHQGAKTWPFGVFAQTPIVFIGSAGVDLGGLEKKIFENGPFLRRKMHFLTFWGQKSRKNGYVKFSVFCSIFPMEDPKPTPKTRFSALYPLQNGPSGLKIWENTPRGPFSMPPLSILNKKKFCEKSRGGRFWGVGRGTDHSCHSTRGSQNGPDQIFRFWPKVAQIVTTRVKIGEKIKFQVNPTVFTIFPALWKNRVWEFALCRREQI